MYNSAQNLLTQERGCRCPSARTPQQCPSLPSCLRKPRRICLRLALSNFPAINTLPHPLRTCAHPRAPFFILFCPFSRLLHPANPRKAAQARTTLRPTFTISGFRPFRVFRVFSGLQPLPFHFLTLQPFNLLERHFGTKMKILKTQSFSTSTLQERFWDDRQTIVPFSGTSLAALRHNPTRY